MLQARENNSNTSKGKRKMGELLENTSCRNTNSGTRKRSACNSGTVHNNNNSYNHNQGSFSNNDRPTAFYKYAPVHHSNQSNCNNYSYDSRNSHKRFKSSQHDLLSRGKTFMTNSTLEANGSVSRDAYFYQVSPQQEEADTRPQSDEKHFPVPTTITIPTPDPSSSLSSPSVPIEERSHSALSQLLMVRQERHQSQDEIAKAPIDIPFHFVESIIDRREKIQRSPNKSSLITTIAEDELYDLAQNFIACKTSFESKGVDTHVTIGYHYTNDHCVDGIRRNGLIQSEKGTFGPGVYLGNNPLAFHGRGNIGVLVAVLRGNTTRVTKDTARDGNVRSRYDTFIGNKLVEVEAQNGFNGGLHNTGQVQNTNANVEFYDEIILQQSCQCLPLIRFHSNLVDRFGNPSSRGNEILWQYHREMQRVIDLFFNNGMIGKMQKSDIFPKPPPRPVRFLSPSPSPRMMTMNFARGGGVQVPLHSIYLSKSVNGKWQSDEDLKERRKMVQYIANTIQNYDFIKDLPNVMIYNRFPILVKTLEVNLYRSAPSFEAYAEKTTLEERSRQVVLDLKDKIQHPTGRHTPLTGSNAFARNESQPVVPTYHEKIVYTAPKDMDSFLNKKSKILVPIDSDTDNNNIGSHHYCRPCKDLSDCAICLCKMESGEDIVKINVPGCNHIFHGECIKHAIKMKPNCPICRARLSEPRGTSPSGTMTITSTLLVCDGFEMDSNGTYEIKYEMHSNYQKAYHPNPGVLYLGTERITYLPRNDQGEKLLKRLKYAWKRGLTFTVGTSLTTGRADSITWSSIHHKTSPCGGVSYHGFPDAGYFINCNDELNSLGVPKAIDL